MMRLKAGNLVAQSGVSLKDIAYHPDQILQKLKGKKAELDLLFPDFSLSQQESHFLEVYKKMSSRKLKNPVSIKLNTQTGIAATFLKACIEVAIEKDNAIAASAFISATLDGEKIIFTLLHSECQPIIKKVGKEQKKVSSYEVDKAQRQIRFTALNIVGKSNK